MDPLIEILTCGKSTEIMNSNFSLSQVAVSAVSAQNCIKMMK